MEILLVDDEQQSRQYLAGFLENDLGHTVIQCGDGREALKEFVRAPVPMVLSDIRMPGLDGIKLLEKIKALPEGRTVDFVLLTGYGSMDTAIKALRAGAYDYLLKPTKLFEVEAVVARIAEHQALIRENYELTHEFDSRLAEATRETESELKELKQLVASTMGAGNLCFVSEAMKNIVSIAEKLHDARTVPVIIEGETGTGKEVVAKLIHFGGERPGSAPFIPINCSAISANLFETELFGYEAGAFSGAGKRGQKGKFELAQGGTIFLDEIGDVPLAFQPKLLRVLQERDFYRVGGVRKRSLDVQIICATNRDLVQMVKRGEFREDLFYRLNTGRIVIPPLRERKEDIVPLATMFLEQFASQKKKHFRRFTSDALELIKSYPWPGNVRQLQNAIERIVLLDDGTEITAGHLAFLTSDNQRTAPVPVPRQGEDSITIALPDDGIPLRDIEERVVRRVLEKLDGNKSRTARYLEIAYNTLRSKLKEMK